MLYAQVSVDSLTDSQVDESNVVNEGVLNDHLLVSLDPDQVLKDQFMQLKTSELTGPKNSFSYLKNGGIQLNDVLFDLSGQYLSERLPYEFQSPQSATARLDIGISLASHSFNIPIVVSTDTTFGYQPLQVGMALTPPRQPLHSKKDLLSSNHLPREGIDRLESQESIGNYLKDVDRVIDQEVRELQTQLRGLGLRHFINMDSTLAFLDSLELPDHIDTTGKAQGPFQLKRTPGSEWCDSVRLDKLRSLKNRTYRIQQLKSYKSKATWLQEKLDEKDSIQSRIQNSNPPSMEEIELRRAQNPVSDYKLEHFKLGALFPEISRFGLNGIPVIGSQIEVRSQDGSLFGLTAGRVESNPAFFDKQTFDRNALSGNFSRSIGRTQMMVSSNGFWDGKASSASSPIRNWVNTVHWTNNFNPMLQVDLELGHSETNQRFGFPVIVQEESLELNSTPLSIKDKLAYSGKVSTAFITNSVMTLAAERVGHSFRSLGSPFLRRDYLLLDYNLRSKWWKSRLSSTISYKKLQGNQSGRSVNTNSMQGIGLMVRSHFKGHWNFLARHNPFEQGNNHSDSLLRTNNQMAISNLTALYKNHQRSFIESGMVMFTRTSIEYNMSTRASVRTYILAANYSRTTPSLIYSIGYTLNQNPQNVDSLNFNALNLSVTTKRIKHHITFTSSHRIHGNLAHMHRTGVSFRKKTSVGLQWNVGAFYQYLDGLWGVKRFSRVECRIGVTYRWVHN